jgi:hypothetical protein
VEASACSNQPGRRRVGDPEFLPAALNLNRRVFILSAAGAEV